MTETAGGPKTPLRPADVKCTRDGCGHARRWHTAAPKDACTASKYYGGRGGRGGHRSQCACMHFQEKETQQ